MSPASLVGPSGGREPVPHGANAGRAGAGCRLLRRDPGRRGARVVALFALGLDGRVSRAVEGAVCVIVGGSDCERPDGTTAGSLTTRSGGERAVKLEPAQLRKIADGVEQADLPGLPEDSTSGRTQPDAFGYRVAYQGANVTTESGSIPDRMGPLVASLSEIVDDLDAK